MKWSISNHKGLIIGLLSLFLSFAAYGNPILDRVTAGSATIDDKTPGRVQINQSSGKAIIHWRSFNINKEEATHFQQPQGGVALNRIDANQGASQIFGVLTATGKIILVNQAGIYFGPSARVDVGGIIASTSDILDSNFLAGKYSFDQPSTRGGSIVNEGSIVAHQHGLVALAGNAVQNDGTIRANLGRVVLASGNKFTVDLAGDELINFTVDEEITRPGVHTGNGSTMQHAVSNTGSVIANGGKIIMTAQAARGVLDNVINMSGVAQAKSVYMKKGEIILSANTGKVTVSGKLITTARSKKQSGGTIKVLGERVHIKAPAVLDASGGAGGGTILIGGNYQGKGPEYNAKATYIEKGAFIKADALWNGNGGKIIAWADDATWVYGSLSAMGGPLGGNGGLIETSGKNYLDVAGIRVSTLAPNGKTGIWLLDPADLTIKNNSGTNSNITGTTTLQPTSGASTSILDVGNLVTALGSNSIIVTTTNSGASGGAAGNLTVENAITWASANSLTLTADNNVNIQANITNTTSNSANLTVNAGGSGVINFSNNAQVNIAGTQTYNSPVVLLSDVAFNGTVATPPYPTSGNVFFNSTINGAQNLVAVAGTSGGSVAFGASIGNTTPLTSLQIGGESSTGSVLNIENVGGVTPSIITTGDQVYNLTLFFNTTLTSTTFTSGGNISFSPNVGSPPGSQDLKAFNVTTNTAAPNIIIGSTVATTISGSVGEFSAQKLGDLTITAGTINLIQPLSSGQEGFFTAGNQTYNALLITISSADGAGTTVFFQAGPITPQTITFNGAVQDNTTGGGVALDFQRGSIEINNNFGNNDLFNSITMANDLTVAGNAEIVTTNDQTYNGLVTINNGLTANFSAGGNITFATNLTINANTLNIQSLGNQNYNGLVTLGSGSTTHFTILALGTGDIAFNNSEALTGVGSASINSPATQKVTIFGDIGTTTPLGVLQISGGRVVFGALIPQNVLANSQSFNSLIELNNSDVSLSTGPISSGSSGNISINGSISTLSANRTLTLTGSGNGDHGFLLNSSLIGSAGTPLSALTIAGSNGSGIDTLTLTTNSSSQNWTIDGNKSGSVGLDSPYHITNFDFDNLESLAGGINSDTFTFSSSGFMPNIDGGASAIGSKFLDLSALSNNNVIVLTQIGSGLGFNGTATAGLSSFSNITDIADTTGTNSLESSLISNTVWTINTSNGGSIVSSGQALNFSNVQSLTGGSAGDTFNLSSGVSLTSITGNSGATNTINFLTTPVVLEFSSTRDGVAKTTLGATLVTFANMDNSTGEGGGTVQLPTTTVNTLTVQSDGNASFDDPFNFVNTNNGYTTFILNATDSIDFDGFTPTALTKVSTTVYTAQINGATYTFSGVNLSPTPTPPPPPPGEFVPNYQVVIQGNTTPETKNVLVDVSGIGSLAGFLIGNAIVDQMITSVQDSLVLQQKDIKVNLNCGS